MNRKELVAAVADSAALEHKTVDAALRALQVVVDDAAARGETVSLSGQRLNLLAFKTHGGERLRERPRSRSGTVRVVRGSGADPADLADRLADASSRLDSTALGVLVALEQLSLTLPAGLAEPASALTADEEAVLRETGSLARPFPELAERASLRSAIKLAALLESALTVSEVAHRLGVSTGRIRQRLLARTLYGIQHQDGWRIPVFQFVAGGGQVLGLNAVLPAIPPSMHPLSVVGFLTTPHVDLPADDGDAQSPIDWLQGGGQPEAVVALAADLARR